MHVHFSGVRSQLGARQAVTTRALPFGFGRKKEVIDDEKEEMWRAQQEILKARRQGRTMEGVTERRAEAKAFWKEKEDKKARIRDMLARGEKPPPEKYKPYGEEDEGMKGGIIIPLAPFGIPKFDNGERFDLKAPYTDEGWVDEDADPFKWAKQLFGGRKGKGEGGGAGERRQR